MELARGTDGDGAEAGVADGVVASVIATDSVAVFVMVAAFAMAVGSVAGQGLEIGLALPTAPVALVAS